MDPVVVPVAMLPMKLVVGAGCGAIICAVLWWAVPRFQVFLRIVSGHEPRKPGTWPIP
jgi:hypothetical protein